MPTMLMPDAQRRTWRRMVFRLYDAIAICLSLLIAVELRMNGEIPLQMMAGALTSLPIFLASAIFMFHAFGIYDRVWRLCSITDLTVLVEAATVAIGLPVLAITITGHAHWLPSSVPVIQWLVLIALLAGGRVWRRILADKIRHIRTANRTGVSSNSGTLAQIAIIVGVPEHVEPLLRQLETTTDPEYKVVGIIDTSDQDIALRLRNVPILGGIDAIEHVVGKLTAANDRPTCVILAEGAKPLAGSRRLRLVAAAETLGLTVLRASPPTAIGKNVDLEVMNLADLLGRPQTILDGGVVERVLKGRRVLVTGAGGTIGRELVRQLAAIAPAEILLLDAGEFNLYSIELELRENYPDIKCTALLCSIRQRGQVMAEFARHRPEFVFHAAALKHVPLVETNVCAGVLTNVLGTCNVADAARRHGALAMVQVSTDKAVNPVGVMGATKKLGELYCQALDLAGVGHPSAARFMTVRFGNVLGSSGSLIPLFQRQLKRRAPLTVTHPEITRYFMTVHEAVQLVLHSTARAMECDVKRGRIIVLDMGEPVKVIDIARRMIRLSGLEPDRDVQIEIVGLRPGEKLYEELFNEHEERLPSALPGVFEAAPTPMPMPELRKGLDALDAAIRDDDEGKVRQLLFGILEPAYDTKVQPVPHRAGAKAWPVTPTLATS